MISGPRLISRRAAVVLSATALWWPTASIALSPMQPGLWELRVSTTIARQPQPSESSQQCLTQQDIEHPTKTLPRPDADCALSNIDTQGNRTTYDLSCRRDPYVNRGRMELVTGAASYDGIADMKISAPGRTDTPMTVIVNAKRIGDCAQ